MRRKAIPWTTRCAAALSGACPSCGFRYVPYEDTKRMTEAQFLSLFNLDHNIFYESRHPDRDAYWNLTWMLIAAHREKTRRDLAIIAKGRRIRKTNAAWSSVHAHSSAPWRTGSDGDGATLVARKQPKPPHPTRRSPKLQSRGFDKRFTRKMDGTVVPRKRR